MTRRWIIIALLIYGLGKVVFVAGALWWFRGKGYRVDVAARKVVKPSVMTTTNLSLSTPTLTPTPSPSPTPSPTLPPTLTLNVPFTIQAPSRNWDAEHEELCEEAASVMAQWFAQGKTGVKEGAYQNHIPVATAEAEFKDLVDWENATFGDYKDTTAAQTAQMLKEGLNVSHVIVTTDVSVENFKQQLNRGRIVVVPTAGRLLHNPNFKQPGPVYHMLVIRGYTANDEFVVNDAGIWQGEGWKYKSEILLNAIHDWPGAGNDMQAGRKVALVISKN